MPVNPLRALTECGQSVWLDFITRDLMGSGDLQRLIDEDSLRGMTTNPTIFSKAIEQGEAYDEQIRTAPSGTGIHEIYEEIALEDVRRAADFFRPIYDVSEGMDGFVSIEVRPTLARDCDATVEETRRLWSACDRANLMIKIPGTREGLPAIESCLAEGINVNVTLLFSVERYREVMQTWYAAMERRLNEGLPAGRVASVASFFVSRVDSMVDKRLDVLADEAASVEERDGLRALRSKAGVANARLAYHAFCETILNADRFRPLREKGVKLQRPLWASTSTKDASLSDVYYVEELAGPETVNTLPPQTLEAYRDQGKPEVRIDRDPEGARSLIETLERLGIRFSEVTDQLEVEGVRKFTDSYEELLGTIETQRASLSQG